ncbi:(S)-sulfolactate dehydrogenase [Clostridium tepidiprofundi DSM 19306]|uniref:(S)-sulfolactate dehydrogenase n=1 Tax=Clostridium tepidiprofundi DSM 19306 TaxID=1121338 RepID=A0A151B505_9CLOT|nr:phosphoglycerate dehydrogenase [Clostridium tepidiprofundi]KYH34883.1 (S)-sulfolactate dehydrogenase [Clostridium tepidiprofundi DSM 19306]
MSIKALFTYDYGKEKMNSIKKLGYDITIINERDIEYCNEIKETEVLVCYNPFETLDISKMDKLRWIQLSSIGIDQLPVEIAIAKNIVVTNNRGGYSIPIGEWIVLKTLEMLKNSKRLYMQQMGKKWRIDTSILELYGKTIGFVGTGTIAREAAKRLKGFEVNILGVNTKGRCTEYFDKCFSIEELDKMLSLSDIVVITIPYTETTHKLIDCKRFSSMKNGVYFINVARGNVVDECELIKNLKNKKIKAAALDVFEDEPLSMDSPLWNLENAIITPHNSWVSEMRNDRRFEGIYRNMERYSKGMQLYNIVDLRRGY